MVQQIPVDIVVNNNDYNNYNNEKSCNDNIITERTYPDEYLSSTWICRFGEIVGMLV